MATIIAPSGKAMGSLVKAFAKVGVAKADKELSALVDALE
jgi:hypothetical protein